MKGTIIFDETGGGSFSAETALLPEFSAYLSDMLFLDAGSSDPLFEEEVVKTALSQSFTAAKAAVPARDRLVTEGLFTDLESVFSELSDHGSVSPVSLDLLSDGRKRITIILDQDSARRFLVLFMDTNNPVTTGIGGLLDEIGNRDSFLENFSWMMSDYLENGSAETLLGRSVMDFTVRVPGIILTQEGGEISASGAYGGREARFCVSLGELLDHGFPVVYRIVYQ